MTNKVLRASIAVAAANTTGMATYHFFLPTLWNWDSALTQLPPAIHWAAHSINFFFSFLLFAGGVLTFLALRRNAWQRPEARPLLVVMAAFWAANVIYQLIDPLPLPRQLMVARIGFVGFAALTLVAYSLPLVATRHARMPG